MKQGCGNCKNRSKCYLLCDKINQILDSLTTSSLKSNYLIKFVDPIIIEKIGKLPPPFGIRDIDYYLIIRKFLIILTKKERSCIKFYYGLTKKGYKTQQSIAKVLKITQPVVCYHLKKARNKLRKKLNNLWETGELK